MKKTDAYKALLPYIAMAMYISGYGEALGDDPVRNALTGTPRAGDKLPAVVKGKTGTPKAGEKETDRIRAGKPAAPVGTAEHTPRASDDSVLGQSPEKSRKGKPAPAKKLESADQHTELAARRPLAHADTAPELPKLPALGSEDETGAPATSDTTSTATTAETGSITASAPEIVPAIEEAEVVPTAGNDSNAESGPSAVSPAPTETAGPDAEDASSDAATHPEPESAEPETPAGERSGGGGTDPSEASAPNLNEAGPAPETAVPSANTENDSSEQQTPANAGTEQPEIDTNAGSDAADIAGEGSGEVAPGPDTVSQADNPLQAMFQKAGDAVIRDGQGKTDLKATISSAVEQASNPDGTLRKPAANIRYTTSDQLKNMKPAELLPTLTANFAILSSGNREKRTEWDAAVRNLEKKLKKGSATAKETGVLTDLYNKRCGIVKTEFTATTANMKDNKAAAVAGLHKDVLRIFTTLEPNIPSDDKFADARTCYVEFTAKLKQAAGDTSRGSLGPLVTVVKKQHALVNQYGLANGLKAVVKLEALCDQISDENSSFEQRKKVLKAIADGVESLVPKALSGLYLPTGTLAKAFKPSKKDPKTAK
jgi:hypothetical protein